MPGTKVFSDDDIRRVEANILATGLSPDALMESVATRMGAWLAKFLARNPRLRGALWLVGPGNNGGDALACLRYLLTQHGPALRARWGVVHVVYMDPAAAKLRTQRALLEPWREHLREYALNDPAQVAELEERLAFLSHPLLAVDGFFGHGYRVRAASSSALVADSASDSATSEVDGESDPFHLDWLRALPRRPCVVALDLPSGLDAQGRRDRAFASLRADVTLCVGGPKLEQLMGDGPEQSGRLVTLALGAPAAAWSAGVQTQIDFVECHRSSRFARELAERGITPRRISLAAHKNTRGRVLVVGGQLSAGGAPALVARAALGAGAGYVTVVDAGASDEQTHAAGPAARPGEWGEWVVRPAPADQTSWRELLAQHDVLVLGPGLPAGGVEDAQGRTPAAWEMFRAALWSLGDSLPAPEVGADLLPTSETRADPLPAPEVDATRAVPAPELNNSAGGVDARAKSQLALVVVDGGALPSFARWSQDRPLRICAIATPHPKEAQDFLRARGEDVPSPRARFELAQSFARAWTASAPRGAWILKGAYPLCGTHICSGSDVTSAVDVASARLATAGMGDSLCGVIAGGWLRLSASDPGVRAWGSAVCSLWAQARADRQVWLGAAASEVAAQMVEQLQKFYERFAHEYARE